MRDSAEILIDSGLAAAGECSHQATSQYFLLSAILLHGPYRCNLANLALLCVQATNTSTLMVCAQSPGLAAETEARRCGILKCDDCFWLVRSLC